MCTHRALTIAAPVLLLGGLVSACQDDRGGSGGDDGITTYEGDGSSGEGSDGDGDDADKLDLSNSDVPGNACPDGGGGGGDGDFEFSFIWISNSPEGTVSKVDTRTAIETARYIAGPGTPDPSRTSVNLLGDMVVVSRGGGIAKIAVSEDRCLDDNGTPGIQTSQGPGDVLAWGSDECVLWHLPLPGTGNLGPRPVAWEGADETGCAKPNPRVWVGYYDGITGYFKRLNGETGGIEDELSVPWSGVSYGPYGGATNKAGDFWVVGWQVGPLIRIDAETVVADVHQIPPPIDGDLQHTYGMALDKEGHPWIAGSRTIYHFDPNTETWDHMSIPMGSLRGLQIDKEGRGWVAVDFPSGVVEVDVVSKTITNPGFTIPGASQPVGVSIDVDGYVWVVDQSASMAFKIDPDTYQTAATVTGLVGPYTYSDMTGAGLDLVTNPPAG